ncbi:hypothetical protein [Ammoniphilus resinae]|uniref:Uncharacterized protein n=1 Tax=Ammoniphilus resinae TaxID=861532 RepID=A0ABS4GUW4_9BACL|nr:hypothetical protein [Ammoniphilus resinae]MBP1933927.1 hypothetical protein [Ammoniphilus resinae]
MQKGFLMLLLGGVFLLAGLFTMPMRRVNPRQNLVDNPFGWGLFGFGLSSLIIGIATNRRSSYSEENGSDDVVYVSTKEKSQEEELPVIQ